MLMSQMRGCLEEVQWATCVVRWRARCDLPAEYEFACAQKGLRSCRAPRLDPSSSAAARASKIGAVNQWRLEAAASEEEAQLYLAANYAVEGRSAVARRLRCPERRGVLTICWDCYTHAGDDRVSPAPEREMRTRDFAVDPARCSPVSGGVSIERERSEGALRWALPARRRVPECSGSARASSRTRWQRLRTMRKGCSLRPLGHVRARARARA